MLGNPMLILFILSLAVQCFFFLFFFTRLAFYTIPAKSIPECLPSVSIVVCAHNECENLKKLLPLLLSQEHPSYEVIVVNDRSDDDSRDYLATLWPQSPQLKIINMEASAPGASPKKTALTAGILAAANEILLLTDADCIPCSPQWARLMTAGLAGQGKEACIGYGPYEKSKGLLNLLIRFETLYTATQYLSFALAGRPYMGVGRNMAYTKDLFLRNNGFESHSHLLSGDDDLFGNECFHSHNLIVEIRKESQTLSVPKYRYADWFRQKTRHLSAGKQYKTKLRISLGALMLSHFFFFLAFFSLLFNDMAEIMIFGFIFRTFLIIYIFVLISKKLGENIKWYWLPMLDFLYIINYITVGLNSFFSKNSKWT